MIVGTKADLRTDSPYHVKSSEGAKLAKKLGCPYLECSGESCFWQKNGCIEKTAIKLVKYNLQKNWALTTSGSFRGKRLQRGLLGGSTVCPSKKLIHKFDHILTP